MLTLPPVWALPYLAALPLDRCCTLTCKFEQASQTPTQNDNIFPLSCGLVSAFAIAFNMTFFSAKSALWNASRRSGAGAHATSFAASKLPFAVSACLSRTPKAAARCGTTYHVELRPSSPLPDLTQVRVMFSVNTQRTCQQRPRYAHKANLATALATW